MSEDLLGSVFGKVKLERILGEGGAGVVYRGQHLTLDRPVAVKVLKSQIGSDECFQERFRREAKIAANINDPSIVRVLDYGEDNGHLYLVMDYINGYSLGRFLRQKNAPLEEITVVKILLAIARALKIAYEAGVVHRDIKPDNLLLSKAGTLHLADLGLAKKTGSNDLTQDRVVVGSPAYMAPETFTPGLEIDSRVDQYALGVIGYQIAFGTTPYKGEMQQILMGHRDGSANWSQPTACSKRVIGIIRRMMTVNREHRYVNPTMIIEELRPILAGLSKKKRRLEGKTEGSSTTHESGTSEFAGIVQFLEGRIGAHTSTTQGGQVTHTTTRERWIVWVLTALVFGAAIVGWQLSKS